MSMNLTLSGESLAAARKAGYLTRIARIFGLKDADALLAFRTKSGSLHVSRICGAGKAQDASGKCGRRTIHAYVRGLTDQEFAKQFNPGFRAFLASVWQCKTGDTFLRLRKVERTASPTSNAQRLAQA